MKRLLTLAILAAAPLLGCGSDDDSLFCTELGCGGEVTLEFATPSSTNAPFTVLIAVDTIDVQIQIDAEGRCVSTQTSNQTSCNALPGGGTRVGVLLIDGTGSQQRAVSFVILDSMGAVLEQSAATLELTTQDELNGPGCGVCWSGGTFHLGP